MLDYLVTSRARRELLRRLWLDGDSGNVSELARSCRLSFATAHHELEAMKAAGLALAEREGTSLEYRANRRHPQADALIGLLTPAAHGGVLVKPATGDPRPGREDAFIDSLVLSHEDEEAALTVPTALWRQRDALDYGRLARAATRRNERHLLGFYLQLTSLLSGDPRFRRRAIFLRDRRRTMTRPFFTSGTEASGKPLPLALRWGFRLNMDLARFAAAFTRELRSDHG
jgi:DNA-binding transcriptional ArsR family regulator